MLSPDLLNILVCPVCNGELREEADLPALCCLACGLAYPFREGIPVMLADQAHNIKSKGAGRQRQ